MERPAVLSEEAREVVARERGAVEARVEDLRRQSAALHAVVDEVDGALARDERLLRQMDEMLGLAPQLALEALTGELRGQRLREIAVQILRERKDASAEIHYTDWYALVTRAGIRVGGKAPMATFLTQIAKAPEVESVRPRSGLYRLKSA